MIGFGIVWGILTVVIKALYAALDSSIGWIAAALIALLLTLGVVVVFGDFDSIGGGV
jgi:hypothetical protein